MISRLGAPRSLRGLIHPSAWKGNSAKPVCRILQTNRSGGRKCPRTYAWVHWPTPYVVVPHKDAASSIENGRRRLGHLDRWSGISDVEIALCPDLAQQLVDLVPEGSLLFGVPPSPLRVFDGPVYVLVEGIAVYPVALRHLVDGCPRRQHIQYHPPSHLVGLHLDHLPPPVGVFARMLACSSRWGRTRCGILRQDHRVLALRGRGRSSLPIAVCNDVDPYKYGSMSTLGKSGQHE
jgi:hypothetical protein